MHQLKLASHRIRLCHPIRPTWPSASASRVTLNFSSHRGKADKAKADVQPGDDKATAPEAKSVRDRAAVGVRVFSRAASLNNGTEAARLGVHTNRCCSIHSRWSGIGMVL